MNKEMSKEFEEQLIKVLEFSRLNRLCIHPATDIFDKVQRTIDAGHCVCDSNRSCCPCDQALDEVKENGWCKCMLFCSHIMAHNYCIEFDIRDSEGELLKPFMV